jgi:5-methyltetrahydrofolate--homocysteine methyltransferase
MASPGPDRRAGLVAIMGERIPALDGDVGAMLQSRDPDAAGFGGPELEGCNEHL